MLLAAPADTYPRLHLRTGQHCHTNQLKHIAHNDGNEHAFEGGSFTSLTWYMRWWVTQ